MSDTSATWPVRATGTRTRARKRSRLDLNDEPQLKGSVITTSFIQLSLRALEPSNPKPINGTDYYRHRIEVRSSSRRSGEPADVSLRLSRQGRTHRVTVSISDAAMSIRDDGTQGVTEIRLD
jgi:hypothetical protein